MLIYFVRHGHPDYENDSLTEIGTLQAEAAAKRLANSGIQEIYSSPQGRAYQTAEHTARLLNLEIQTCEFIHELSWGSIDAEPVYGSGQPWKMVAQMTSEGKSLTVKDWKTEEIFTRTKLIAGTQYVADGIDRWLETLGYTREGEFYRVGENTNKTVAMFSHCGSSTAALAHILNIPFPQLCAIFQPKYTSVTGIILSDVPGTLTVPKIQILNDYRHTENLMVANRYE